MNSYQDNSYQDITKGIDITATHGHIIYIQKEKRPHITNLIIYMAILADDI